MTVSTETNHNEYTGNGVTTAFPYTFRIFKKSDLVVFITSGIDGEDIKTLRVDTDYTVTGAGNARGGSIVLKNPLAAGVQISISRELPATQETSLRNQGKFFPEVHEDAFDKLTMLIQQVRSMFSLALRKPSFLANYYDAAGNYIRNLRDPSRPQDAATKNYVDKQITGNTKGWQDADKKLSEKIDSNHRRTLRVSDVDIQSLPAAAERAEKVLSFDRNGQPIAVAPASGSAVDVLNQLAGKQGSLLVGGVENQFETICDMKLARLVDGSVCRTSGYHAPEDGGGASYIFHVGAIPKGFQDDGFLYHQSERGYWKLRSPEAGRYDIRVAGVIGDGVADDTESFLSAIKKPILIDNLKLIVKKAVDINKYATYFDNSTTIDIEGVAGRVAQINFIGCNGFVGKEFFRYLRLNNLQIVNPDKNKRFIGFVNNDGAENIDMADIEFVNFKVGRDIHAWVSSIVRCRSVNCEYAGFLNGTSITYLSNYSWNCDFGYGYGVKYSEVTNEIVTSVFGLSYTTLNNGASDGCGIPYTFGGNIKNVTLLSSGAESMIGEYVFDLSRMSTAQPRNHSLTVQSFDLYIENKSRNLLAVTKLPAAPLPSRNKNIAFFTKCNWYSDIYIPAFTGSGSGANFDDTCSYNRPLTIGSNANELIVGKTRYGNAPVGFPDALVQYGGFQDLQKISGLFFVPENSAKFIISFHNESDSYSSGRALFGSINIYPVHKSGVNSDRQSGILLFSISSDYAGGLLSVNVQKSGNLSRFSCVTRLNSGIQELVITINSTVDSMFEVSYFSNGILNPTTRRYYIE